PITLTIRGCYSKVFWIPPRAVIIKVAIALYIEKTIIELPTICEFPGGQKFKMRLKEMFLFLRSPLIRERFRPVCFSFFRISEQIFCNAIIIKSIGNRSSENVCFE